MTQAELHELARLLNRLGAEVELEKEEAKAYLPDISDGDDIRDFYLPRVPENFYYDPKVFRKLLGIR